MPMRAALRVNRLQRATARSDADTQRRAFLSLPDSRFCQCGCGRRSDTVVTSGDGSVRATAYVCAGLARAAPCTSG